MSENISVVVSVSVALAAIISPILVALINNRHNRKIRQMELQYDKSVRELTMLYENKRIAFSNFLLNAGKVCTDEELHSVEQEFYGQAQLAMLYSSEENRKLIATFVDEIVQYLDEAIPSDKCSYFLGQLSKITEALNNELSVSFDSTYVHPKRK